MLFVITVGLDDVRVVHVHVDSHFALEAVLHFRKHGPFLNGNRNRLVQNTMERKG